MSPHFIIVVINGIKSYYITHDIHHKIIYWYTPPPYQTVTLNFLNMSFLVICSFKEDLYCLDHTYGNGVNIVKDNVLNNFGNIDEILKF